MESFLKVLGLSRDASSADIKKAYRQLAKQWHPDRFHDDPIAQQEAKERFQKINEAYQALIAQIFTNSTTNNSNSAYSPFSNTAIKVEKVSPDFYYHSGVEYAQQGKDNEAIEAFNLAIRSDINYLKAYQYRGFLLEKLGFIQRAQADFTKVVELKTGNLPKSQTKSEQKVSYSSSKTKSNQTVKNTSTWQVSFISNADVVTAIAINAQGTLAAVGYENQRLYLWNITQKKQTITYKSHKKAIRCLLFSANQTRLFSGGEDNKIYVHNIDGTHSRLLGNPKFHHSQTVTSLALSSDGTVLVSGSADKTVKIWFLGQNKEPITLMGFATSITALIVHPNNQYFIIGSLDNNIRLRNLQNGKLIKSIPVNSSVSSLAISPDGNLLAVGGFNHSICIIDLDLGGIVQTLQGHQELVSDLSFFADNKHLISVSWDHTIKKWSLQSGEYNNVGEHQAPILSAKMSNIKKILVTGGRDKRIGIWRNVLESS